MDDANILKERLKTLIMIHDCKKIRHYVLSQNSCTNALNSIVARALEYDLPFADAVRKIEREMHN
jgi:hypothetical protein